MKELNMKLRYYMTFDQYIDFDCNLPMHIMYCKSTRDFIER